MTNRDWLNTLSDEEYAKEWLKIEKMLHGDCGFHIETIMQYLQLPHETTADEIKVEIKTKNEVARECQNCKYGAWDDYSWWICTNEKSKYECRTSPNQTCEEWEVVE